MTWKTKVVRVQEMVFRFEDEEIRKGETPEDVAMDIALHAGDWNTVDEFVDYIEEE